MSDVARVLICGGREYADAQCVASKLHTALFRFESTNRRMIIIEGGAKGADTLARKWAETKGVPYATVPALWDYHGRKAGPLRNDAMLLLQPTHCIAFPGGTGTEDMIRRCESRDIPVWRINNE